MTVPTASVLAWLADAAVLFGVVVMTIGVIGIYRMPTVYMKLHAAAKSVFLGVCAILFGVIDSGDPAIITRAVLIALLLILTTPVAAYEIARAAAHEELVNLNVELADRQIAVEGNGHAPPERPPLTSRPHVEGH